ncbi:NAD(P)/FAD-dependent oxidoreductase [Paenibacillus barengoltzii]|uniref:NADH:ubiquinone reductase (non-electrogenic) n=1 Tax=Paenibacillus barengoltzii J12 TaxID=935846 RepID=A0ABY1LYS6_9BACL|nr:NAD(P)/FAD-dependent oxidoreductase [Paenibacillus barengoltzii]MEC2346581.1 NAD(P)/FAD-dependent oxidoreductase [Paenibacillus barengoltzii]SMF05670.1 NADH dehydrogenase [Paenibacillus barengoltzii]SMF36481.1 NADH dehydrogenase [Paenibacillus barengoltzii J12]
MKKIVVLGGGYGGVVTSKHLAKLFKKDKDVEIQLIDRNPYHTLLTELHEVAANRAPEDSVKIELKKIFAGQKVDVVLDSIDAIDFNANELRSKRETYKYDYLVIGTGCKPTFFGIPGAEEHALTLWSYEDAVRLKEQVRRKFSEAAKVSNPAKRRKMLSFVVVGAGFTGVELVGELAEFRDELCKEFYIDPSEVRLVVADMAPKILPILPDKLIEKATKRLHKMNVEIITSAKITGVTPTSVQLGEGKELEADTIVWTAGVEGSELVGKLDVKQEGRKRIVTNDKLQSVDHENVYIVGDNIFFIPEGETRPVPQMVENAEQAGPLIAHNIYADVHGKPKKSYKPGFHGTMVCIGSRYGVANVGLPNKMFMMSGFMAMFCKHLINMYYLFTVAGFAKVWTYMMHEFFHVNNRRSFVGGHFAKRSPNFWLLPLRIFVGYKWLEEGLDKLPKVWKDPSNIFLIPASPKADVVSAASEAASEVTKTVDAQAAASAVESASTAVTALPVPGFIKSIVSWFMDVFFYTSDGGYTALATVFQFFMVFAEIALGIMIIVGLFTAVASAATVALGVMIWSSSMASTEMLWYMTAGVALIGGSGSTFGLDYYVLPWLKKQWKRIPFVRRWYLYTE